MALDLEVWHPAPAPRAPADIVIGWAGAPVNLRYLHAVEPALARLFRDRGDVCLHILSGERPRLSVPFTYEPFHPDRVPGFVRELDIGLLPLEDDPFSNGKSPIKAIQYIASGIPVVANIHGATRDILQPGHAVAVHDDQWETALRDLIEQPDRRAAMGGRARSFAERHFDRTRVAPRLIAAITGDEAAA
jgi:glycosyltransferase involved in cell wall biosynthesis